MMALQERIAGLEAELEDAARLFLVFEEEQQRQLEELQQLLRHDSPLAARTRVSLEETGYALLGAEQRLHALNELYASLVSSGSWRYTKPFRALARLLRGDREQFADGMWNEVRPHAVRLPPVRERMSDQITYALISSLSSFLQASNGYRRWHQAYVAERAPRSAGVVLNPGNYVQEIARLTFAAATAPVLSIIIASSGNLKSTLSALRSLSVFPPAVPFEVIVAADAAGDEQMALLRSADGLRYIEHPERLGFLRSCNGAAQSARGTYLFLMTSDAEVTLGALDELLKVFSEHADTGLAGCKLIHQDGRLQQAGGIVWQDGSCQNFGQFDNPSSPAYNVLRETDYCSGAAIMIARELYTSLGGFDECYLPAGYEDVDLAFKVRRAGFKVIYQPASTVTHHDGKAANTKSLPQIGASQSANQNKFRERWATALEHDQFAPGSALFQAKDRSRQKRCLLVIDQSIPAGDRDAGSRSLIQFMMTFLKMGLNVKFWPKDGADDPHYASRLQQAGIEVLLESSGTDPFATWYRDHAEFIDYVLLSRPHVSVDFIPVVKSTGHAQILFYGHDIHHLRIAMQMEAGVGDASAARSLEFFRKLEPQLWPQMDVIYYPSASETELIRTALAENGANIRIRTVPVYAFDSFPGVADLGDRTGLLFVAGFKHSPNADGVIWFKEQVMPLILKSLPQVHLTIVGSNPGAAVTALGDRNTTVTGFISDADLELAYASCRVCIAPLRFGAGMKGKVAEALRFGVPMVTTPVGIQGLEGASDAIAVATDAKAFADQVLALLHNDDLWRVRSELGQTFAREHLSSACLQRIFALDVQGAH